jgi:PLP dependent protein
MAANQKNSIETGFFGVQNKLSDAATSAKRNPADITLIAVSKTHGLEAIRHAANLGQLVFGENRVQEAAQKFPTLRQEFPNLELHLIGPLQTNKVKDAVKLFDVIQTLDRESLAKALQKEMVGQNKSIPCYVQINTGKEIQKAGIDPEAADAFIVKAREHYKLEIVGLMCIPPVDEDPAPHFALLGEIAKRHNIKNLSMGMSSDYAIAVAHGATHVRVGTAIFGARPSYQTSD